MLVSQAHSFDKISTTDEAKANDIIIGQSTSSSMSLTGNSGRPMANNKTQDIVLGPKPLK